MPRPTHFEIPADQPERAIAVVPKMAVPGIGWLAHCRDPEGNTFGVMQADERAK